MRGDGARRVDSPPGLLYRQGLRRQDLRRLGLRRQNLRGLDLRWLDSERGLLYRLDRCCLLLLLLEHVHVDRLPAGQDLRSRGSSRGDLGLRSSLSLPLSTLST